MIKLKPSDLGVTGKERTIKDHQTLVEKKLLSLKNKIAGSICKAIMSTQSGGKVPIDGLTPQDINEIKNYFAEVAAPILILNERSIPGIAPMSKVFYSTSDIERLFDFKLFINGKEILISNKQLKGGTNTLKPGDELL